MNFEQLFDDVYPQLYRYALRMSGDADLAEGGAAGVRAWLFTVATHLLRDRA